MSEHRIEKDSMGEVKVPAKAYYGAQTQRAVENFPISGQALPKRLIRALGLVKVAAAVANRDVGKLKKEIAEPIIAAAREVAAGKWDGEFPLDVFQTGSGTSSNMNVNEVISNRAIEQTGGDRFQAKKPIHPNDHVNMGQSTNDMFPTAIHVAVGQAIAKELAPVLKRFHGVLAKKARDWDDIIKIGRTHLADATPIRLGQEFSGYASQMHHAEERLPRALHALSDVEGIRPREPREHPDGKQKYRHEVKACHRRHPAFTDLAHGVRDLVYSTALGWFDFSSGTVVPRVKPDDAMRDLLSFLTGHSSLVDKLSPDAGIDEADLYRQP